MEGLESEEWPVGYLAQTWQLETWNSRQFTSHDFGNLSDLELPNWFPRVGSVYLIGILALDFS